MVYDSRVDLGQCAGKVWLQVWEFDDEEGYTPFMSKERALRDAKQTQREGNYAYHKVYEVNLVAGTCILIREFRSKDQQDESLVEYV